MRWSVSVRVLVAGVLAVLACAAVACTTNRASELTPTTGRPVVASPLAPSGPSMLVVAKTGGDGVWLRRSPSTNAEKIRSWSDGTFMRVVAARREAEGSVGENVRDPAGNVGRTVAEYLARPPSVPTGKPVTLLVGGTRGPEPGSTACRPRQPGSDCGPTAPLWRSWAAA